MLFYVELPDDVILDMEAKITGASEEKVEEQRVKDLKREIYFLTETRPVSQGDIKNAISERTRRPN